MNDNEGGWKTVGGGGGWRERAAARAGEGGGERSGYPSGERSGYPSGERGGYPSGERSGYPSGERSGYPSGGGLGRSASSAGEPPMTRTSMGGWGQASGERSGFSSGERSGFSSSGGGRPMPAAFGGGEREKRNDRLEEQRQRAAADAERKRHEEREAAEAAKRLAKKMDLKDEEEYPALGGAGATSRPNVKPKAAGLNFLSATERGAALAAAQEAEEAARARELYQAAYAERLEAEERAAHRRRLAQITTRCYDDGFDEYEPPEEEDAIGGGGGGGGDDMGEMPEFEDDEEDLREAGVGARATGEFNAHLAVTRRSGDKSDW